MRWPRWNRKIPDNRAGEPDDPCVTTGPNQDCPPGAPPPNIPHHLPEARDPERSETTPTRRCAAAIRFVRCTTLLLYVAWSVLPHELRQFLIHAVQK